MTSIVRVCPRSGGLAEGVDTCAPHCYLLEVDQFTFLLDCGWDASFTGAGKANLDSFLRYVSIAISSKKCRMTTYVRFFSDIFSPCANTTIQAKVLFIMSNMV